MRSVILALALSIAAFAAENQTTRIYIEPMNGYESYIAAAIVKKHVPVVVTEDRDRADFVITSAVTEKEESTGSKIARCAFAYCVGINGSQTVSIRLVNPKAKEVIFAYNVRKAGAANYQSSSEAVAKHLKQFLASKPQS
jgi:hypothetical protein